MSEASSSPISSPATPPIVRTAPRSSSGPHLSGTAAFLSAAQLSTRINEWLGALGGRSATPRPRDTPAPSTQDSAGISPHKVLDGFAPVGGEFQLSLGEIMEDLEYGSD